MMSTASSILWQTVRFAQRRAFVGWVAAIIGVTALSSGTLHLLGTLRANPNELSENRSECESSERIHAAVPQVVSARTKAGAPCRPSSAVKPADFHAAVRRALAESRCRVPSIVYWSATMRC